MQSPYSDVWLTRPNTDSVTPGAQRNSFQRTVLVWVYWGKQDSIPVSAVLGVYALPLDQSSCHGVQITDTTTAGCLTRRPYVIQGVQTSALTATRDVDCLLSYLTFQQLVSVSQGRICFDTQRQKLNIQLAILSSHRIQTFGSPDLTLTLWRPAPRVWVCWAKQDPIPVSAVLGVYTLPLDQSSCHGVQITVTTTAGCLTRRPYVIQGVQTSALTATREGAGKGQTVPLCLCDHHSMHAPFAAITAGQKCL